MTDVDRASSQQSVRRELLWVAVGQATSALGSLVGVRLLTSSLSPASYGELALAMTGVVFAQQAVQFPVQNAALRFWSSAESAVEVPSFLAALRWMVKSSIALLLGVVGVVAGYLLLSGAVRFLPLLAATAAFICLTSVSLAIDGLQNAQRRRAVTAWHDTISVWARFLLAVLLIRWTGSGSSALAMLGYVLAALLALTSQAFFFPPKLAAGEGTESNAAADRDVRRRMIAYSVPLGLVGVSFATQMAGERWALAYFASVAAVGQYAVLFQLGYYPVITISNALVQFISPIIFSSAGDGRSRAGRERTRRLTYRLLAAVAVAALGCTAAAWLLHDLIFAILVDAEYRDVSRLLPLVVLSAGLVALGQVASLSRLAETKSGALLAPRVLSATVAVLASAIGAHTSGVRGVLIAGILGGAVFATWTIVGFVLASREPDHPTDEPR